MYMDIRFIYFINQETQFIDAVLNTFVSCVEKNTFIRQICKGLVEYKYYNKGFY